MGFFKKLFGKPAQTTQGPEASPGSGKTSITLLFPRLPKFEILEPVFMSEGVLLPVAFSVVTEGSESMATLRIGTHRVLLVGFSAALPQEVQQATIHLSNWPEESKRSMFDHRAHLICYCESGSADPLEQLLLLYKVAAAFRVQGLLGVADETAMTANPAELIGELFAPMDLATLRTNRSLPYLIWCGVIKLIKPDGQVWWVSRGHERFGLPDLAHLAPMGEGERIMDLFESLLNYMFFDGARIEAGHTAEIGDSLLGFEEPYEYADYIATPSNTALVVTMTGAS